MLNKGDLISGLYNTQVNGDYTLCTKIGNEYIQLNDISDYKIKLFKSIPKNSIIENIDVMEKLTNANELLINNSLIKILEDYDEVYINQEILRTLISNDISKFEIKYMEGFYLKDKFIPVYLTPIDNLNTYLIKKSNGELESYKKLKFSI